MIGDALNTAQSISNFGMLAVTAGFFLVLILRYMVKWHKNMKREQDGKIIVKY